MTWDEDRSTYRNQQTGEIVGPREIIDERDIFLQNVEASFDLLVDKLFDGTLSIQEWQAEFRKDLKSTYIVCFTLADGGFNNFSDPKKYEIQEILRSEYRSLYDFALDISDGKYSHNGDVWEREQVKLRARSFVHAVQKAVQWP
ncbi:MAG: hypothetical protein IPM76_15460 [Chloroflexi bacterium]|nr:hypothetical protein [Chloroflexota bacterium]